ncbi:uncharacterized protein BYT42DRAFT_267360 [Radiomyces spectabilis]|uniref:uncharacterized protein n=1 Tax=Radiomyces spectabilis TaxID=64574 RepID=UPI0022203D7C|nr:uncharacterized protein BYT42DRAFT_267360 [Radiomyces spectabilis]KAI8384602.1 hypothetical protein BYT42DRAFT_267360 [Radiomyces spectabilis]
MGSFTAFHTFTNTHSSMKPSQKMMRWIVIKLWPHHRQSTSRYRTPSPTVDMHYASSLNQSSQSSQSCMRQEDSLSFHETKMKTTPFSFTCEELVMDEPPNAILSPTTPHFTIPICFEELDSAVPWRVLEVDEDEQDIGDSFLQPKNSQDGTDPRKSLSSSPRTDSWLELNDDPPTSPSRVSQWFHKRGDSFENVRERMARSSKSLRRWRQQQQQQQQQSHPSDLQEPGLASLSTGTRQSRALSDSFDPTMLQAVPESPSEEESFNDTAVRAVTVLANSMHSNYRMI